MEVDKKLITGCAHAKFLAPGKTDSWKYMHAVLSLTLNTYAKFKSIDHLEMIENWIARFQCIDAHIHTGEDDKNVL